MIFSNLIGQDNVKHILSEAVQSGRVRQAYIFNGPEGVGRKTAAMDFIMMSTCDTQTACGNCTSCILCQNGTNPDVVTINTGKKASIGVDEIRALENMIITAPEYSKYKFFIIENSELMTLQAQNALLKTLEEPPAYAVIIMICSNVSALIDTIKSRSTQIDFARNTRDEIKNVLFSKAGITDEDMIEQICDFSDGSIGRSLSAINSEEYTKVRTQVKQLLDKLANAPSDEDGRVYHLLQKLFNDNQEKKDILFYFLMLEFRNLLVKIGVESNKVDLYNKISYYKVAHCLEYTERTWKQIKQNVNYRLATNSLVIKIYDEIRKARTKNGQNNRNSF
ncbi:MAG: hypothetical protein IIW02_05335 [Clostridia bacterium]|nr:hypothetical protein [Clostridia bacterium]